MLRNDIPDTTQSRLSVQPSLRSACLCGVFALACFWMQLSVAAAAPNAAPAQNPAPTVIHIDPVGPVFAGQSFTVTGILYRPVDGGTAIIPNRGVDLYIEPLSKPSGIVSKTLRVATVFSDEQGRLKWVIHTKLYSGQYRLYFLFEGTRGLMSSFATTELQVSEAAPGKATIGRKKFLPAQLSVQTTGLIEPGETMTITVQLTNQARLPLASQKVYLHLPGATQQRKTDAKGVAAFVIKKPLASGVNVGLVRYRGQNSYLPAEKTFQLVVKPRHTTRLAFEKDSNETHYVGEELSFVARLMADEEPLLNQLVRFYLDGTLRYGTKTDSEGKAVLRLPRNLVFGSHTISATFRGTDNLLTSSGALPITLSPKRFEVRTVPPLPNVSIMVGQQRIQTDAKGIARLLIEKSGPVSVTVMPYESPDPNVRAQFIRWSDEVVSATRRINIVNGAVVQIGFEVSYPILPNFVEEDSRRDVNMKRLSNIILVNNIGEAVSLTGSAQWLKANRIIRHDDALATATLSYQLRNVTVDGTNVVNEGQQRFKVQRNARWTVKLQMHDLAIATRDALFGFPVGNGVRVNYPKGQWQDVALDTNGRMRIESLSRGSYTVTVQGGFVIRTPTPIALSRSQNLDLPVISYLDISIVGGALATVALFVLLVGRSGVFGRGNRNFENAFLKRRINRNVG